MGVKLKSRRLRNSHRRESRVPRSTGKLREARDSNYLDSPRVNGKTGMPGITRQIMEEFVFFLFTMEQAMRGK